MIFTVIWQPETENDLADLWLNAPDRDAVTRAANQIDAQLKADPYANSESRFGNTRVMFVPPLGVAYDIYDDDCLVAVWAVWHY
jgi:ParE toxin of type II toxin-antitoxin system, parDE